jgi:hypothetical protein
VTPVPAAVPAEAEEASQSSHVGSAEPHQSIVGIVMAVRGGVEQDGDGQADSAQTTGKLDSNSHMVGQRGVSVVYL